MKTGPETEYDTKTEDIIKREDKKEDIMKTEILMLIHDILDNNSLY